MNKERKYPLSSGNGILKIAKKISIVLLLCTICVGAILSLPHKPCYWQDEFLAGVAFIGSSSVKEFFTVKNSITPEVAPVYPFLLYAVTNYLHIDPNQFRYFSILCMMLCVVFFYLTISKLIEPKTAFWASISFALIPLHLWYTLLLLPHVLAFLFCTISFYLFSHLIEKESIKGVDIFLISFINLLLVLTHYMFFWIPFTECLIFLFTKKPTRDRALFILINIVIVFSTVVHIIVINHKFSIAIPPSKDLKQTLLTVLGVSDFSLLSTNSWAVFVQPLFFKHTPMPSWLALSLYRIPIYIVLWGNIIVSILMLWMFFKKLLTIFKKKVVEVDAVFILLIFGIFTPFLFALIQVITGSGALEGRYFYISFACKLALLYFIVGQIRRRSIRLFLTFVILLFFIHNYLLYRTCNSYTDWRACVQYLTDEMSKDDIIVGGEFEEVATLNLVWTSEFNQTKIPPIFYTSSPKSAMEGVSFLQNRFPHSNIWLIYYMKWTNKIPCVIREELKENHFAFQEKLFPSFEGIACYKIMKKQEEDITATNVEDPFISCPMGYDWGQEKKQMRRILKILFGKNNYTPEMDLFLMPEEIGGWNTRLQIVLQLSAMNRTDVVEAFYKKTKESESDIDVSLIFGLTDEEYLPLVKDEIKNLKKRKRILTDLVENLWKDYSEKNYPELIRKCEELKRAGFPYAFPLLDIARLKLENIESPFISTGLFPLNDSARKFLFK